MGHYASPAAPPARRWFRLATPVWLVLAGAQFFLLTGFGKGPLGFLPSEHGGLNTPEAWSKAVHSAAAEAIMSGRSIEVGGHTVTVGEALDALDRYSMEELKEKAQMAAIVLEAD